MISEDHTVILAKYIEEGQVEAASAFFLSGISLKSKGNLKTSGKCMHVGYGTGHWVEESGQDFLLDWLANPSAPIISLRSFL
jgi:hypothetical protein